MGWDGKKLTYPFTKIAVNGNGDLQQALGVSSTGMTQANLFANGYINKFAKYKAFCHSTIFTDRYGDANSQRLAGAKTANWGFGSGFVSGTTVFTTKSDLRSGFTNEWTYLRPTIGNYPLRALDFEGYVSEEGWGMTKYTDAAGNIVLFGPFGVYIQCPATLGEGMNIGFGIEAASSGASDGLLSLADFSQLTSGGFFNFGDWYPGLAFISKTKANNDRFIVLNEKVTHNIDTFFTVPVVSTATYPASAQLPADSYYIVPILAEASTGGAWTSTFPTKVVTLDGWYHECTASATAKGFTWSIEGVPAVSGGVLKARVRFRNTTSSTVTINKLFSYSMTDAISAQVGPYSSLLSACQYWVNSKAIQPGTDTGVKYTGYIDGSSYTNAVVAQYKSLISSNYAIAAGANTYVDYTLTTGSTDAFGHSYNDNPDVRLCIQYDTNKYLCNNIY